MSEFELVALLTITVERLFRNKLKGKLLTYLYEVSTADTLGLYSSVPPSPRSAANRAAEAEDDAPLAPADADPDLPPLPILRDSASWS